MIYNELLVSFGLSLVAVLALSLLVLGKVSVVLLVCLTVVRQEDYLTGAVICCWLCLVVLVVEIITAKSAVAVLFFLCVL